MLWKVRITWAGPGTFELTQQIVYITAEAGKLPDLNQGGIPPNDKGLPTYVEITTFDGEFPII